MSPSDRWVHGILPEPFLESVRAFEERFGARVRLTTVPNESEAPSELLYVSEDGDAASATEERTYVSTVIEGPDEEYELQVGTSGAPDAEDAVGVLAPMLAYATRTGRELQQFTAELSERFEEINLLYSISETLGSTLDLVDGAHKILDEVRDVMGAKRGSIWVHRSTTDALHLAAEVGEDGREAPVSPDEPDTITAMVFREGRSLIATRMATPGERDSGGEGDSFLSVPIRYSPGQGGSRTVGVMNLIGRRDGSRFNAANQRLLAAIASQVGAAIENNRLVRKTLSRERMVREMELAHDLQMKLLPDPSAFEAAQAAGRVQPTEQVGGDFYQLFELSGGRVGVMLGDVSLHGFPSALIMTLAMSAAGIYAREHDSPAAVLRGLDDALRDELETTEMFLTVFYGVIDPAAGTLVYANAGHPHAFAVEPEGSTDRLGATDPPVGFAGSDAYHETSRSWRAGEDVLLLFTDGLSDALTTTSRGNGERLVLETAVRTRFSSPEDIIRALFDLTDQVEQRPSLGDDRTALAVRV
ncbi:MAG: GAF domain-containing SpoIIE family protein phosphatase [Gemmatimonadota bacterium]|nr:GAF domain-containing SpoIIE family protein phosphatase [Gemmatimonadota bacterium]